MIPPLPLTVILPISNSGLLICSGFSGGLIRSACSTVVNSSATTPMLALTIEPLAHLDQADAVLEVQRVGDELRLYDALAAKGAVERVGRRNAVLAAP